MARQFWAWASALLLCTTIVGAYSTLYFWGQSESIRSNYDSLLRELENLTILVNIKIDYGNGTVLWHNSTRVPLEASLLMATKTVATVEYSISDFGAFVTKINGVEGDTKHFWGWLYFDRNTTSWSFGPVGSDKWILHDGDPVSWVFTAI